MPASGSSCQHSNQPETRRAQQQAQSWLPLAAWCCAATWGRLSSSSTTIPPPGTLSTPPDARRHQHPSSTQCPVLLRLLTASLRAASGVLLLCCRRAPSVSPAHHHHTRRHHHHIRRRQPQEYPEFLRLFFSPLLAVLTSSPPQFEDSELHKLRHGVLEVFAKLPLNETLRPYLQQLLQVRCLCLRACVRVTVCAVLC